MRHKYKVRVNKPNQCRTRQVSFFGPKFQTSQNCKQTFRTTRTTAWQKNW